MPFITMKLTFASTGYCLTVGKYLFQSDKTKCHINCFEFVLSLNKVNISTVDKKTGRRFTVTFRIMHPFKLPDLDVFSQSFYRLQ